MHALSNLEVLLEKERITFKHIFFNSRNSLKIMVLFCSRHRCVIIFGRPLAIFVVVYLMKQIVTDRYISIINRYWPPLLVLTFHGRYPVDLTVTHRNWPLLTILFTRIVRNRTWMSTFVKRIFLKPFHGDPFIKKRLKS